MRQTIRSFNQLGANAIEYGLALVIITAMVVSAANVMDAPIREMFTCSAQKVRSIIDGGNVQCSGRGSSNEYTVQTDEEKLKDILENYQVDETPIITYVPDIASVDFDGYSRKITEAESVFINQLSALQLYSLSEIGEDTFRIADEFYPKPEDWEHRNQDWQNDGHNDAFRHIYLNVLMTREFGEEWTQGLTTAHESVPGNDIKREAMDLYNNEIGRKIARENPFATEAELQQLVHNAITKGDAVVVDVDGNLQFSDTVG